MSRPTQFTIDLQALCENARMLKGLAGLRSSMAVVKADAYGHGAVPCARALSGLVDAFAVAITEEAIALREAGIELPILVLQGPHSQEDAQVMSSAALWPAISGAHQIDWLEQSGAQFEQIWVKCDTGMHRLGFMPHEIASAESRLTPYSANDIVLMSHFADAEAPDSALTERQLTRWIQLNGASSSGSFSNSAATIGQIDGQESWIRLGYSLYGGSMVALPDGYSLKPVMQFESRIASVRWIDAGESVGYGGRWVARRRSRIATIPAGYGDGYPRAARDGTPIGTQQGTVLLAGKVSMDMVTADITDLPALDVGSPVTLWGNSPCIDEVAGHCDTIGYELCTRITQRTPRRFHRVTGDQD
jgi:alanine racemase